jgi:DNA topoisomerase-1
VLPVLTEGQSLELRELKPEQKFTQPPPRFNEGSLVKALEEDGIGRPSTYASIISVLQAREYVNKIEGKFRPTILGRRLVDKLLHPVFDDILDVEYTARMETQLDEIEQGKADYKETLEAFYKTFKKDLKRAAKEMPNFKEGQPTGETCDKCGLGEMVEKAGKFGIFLACSRYPDCDNTRELEPAEAPTEELDETCENCGRPMVVKRGRFGMFLACTGYPECKTTRKIIATKQGMSAAKPDQIWTRSARTAARTWSSSTAGSASSPRARAIRNAGTSSSSPPASSVRRTAATSSCGSRAAARSSTAARIIRSATSRCGTSPFSSPAPSAAGRS